MTVFKDKDSMYKVLSAFVDKLREDPVVSGRLLESNLVVRFRFREPEGVLTVNLTSDPITYTLDDTEQKPDVELIQTADIANLFWQGRLNIARAIAVRQVVTRGSVPKALALLPTIRPAFQIYRDVLEETGYGDLIVKDGDRAQVPGKRQGIISSLLTLLKKKALLQEYRSGEAFPIPLVETPVEHEKVFRDQQLPDDEAGLKTEMLRRMLLIRRFEEHLSESFAAGEIPTEAIHLSIGQEATAVGVCFALRSSDYMTTTHRGHGHMLAKGADLKGMMAELYGKSGGLCGGKGGSMHVTASDVGALGANGIVGASSVIAAGAGFKSHVAGGDKSTRVAVAFMGDGATNQGMFHEALNMAAVLKLPVLFIIENNLYGEFTPLHRHVNIEKLTSRAEAYGIPGVSVDGTEVMKVYEAAGEAVDRARRGEGPALIECLTYRWHGHMEGDSVPYRPQEEIEEWKQRCPVKKLQDELLEKGVLGVDDLAELTEGVEKELGEAVVYSLESPEPPAGELYTDIFTPDPAELYRPQPQGGTEAGRTRVITCSQGIREALREEMELDGRVFLLGEDVTTGGYFAVTNGLVEQFGINRVIDTPISEYAIGGAAVGAAMVGLRPVAEILFSDFITCCMDPIVNQAAKLRYMSGGQYSLPMVIRTPGGAGLGMAAQHSQSLESLLIQVPGLIIIAPGTAYDTKGLLKAAIRSNNPVLFFENKLLYTATGAVPEGECLVPIGVADVKRGGRDVTVVAVGGMVEPALEAAEECARRGVDVEVVDPRTLVPCDWDTIVQSVIKTGYLVTVEEAPLTGCFGAEVIATVAGAAPGAVKRTLRVAGKNVPIPYNKKLEAMSVPSSEDIVSTVCSIRS